MYKMQHLEVSGAVRHIYIYICVIRRLKVKEFHQASRAQIRSDPESEQGGKNPNTTAYCRKI